MEVASISDIKNHRRHSSMTQADDLRPQTREGCRPKTQAGIRDSFSGMGRVRTSSLIIDGVATP